MAPEGDSTADDAPRAPRSLAILIPAGGIALILVASLFALGVWQVQRLGWKLDLIDRVEARVSAPAVPAPQPAEWPGISAAQDEYRRVTVTGDLIRDAEVQVQALTEAGSGFWVMTPLRTKDGWQVLVNRGFVPADLRDPALRPETGTGPVRIEGLLRLTEPGGGFLRHNDPGAGRWFSRDVAAIAAAGGLDNTAPYFIDAAAAADPASLPRGGMTVISFPNNHLGYAITWFILAAGVLAATIWVGRYEWKLRAGASIQARQAAPPGGNPASPEGPR